VHRHPQGTPVHANGAQWEPEPEQGSRLMGWE
jgi:hypothetical protein